MLHSIEPELVFELNRDDQGHFTARCLSVCITVHGSDLVELNEKLTAAVAAHYPREKPPSPELIHFVMFPED